MNGGGRSTALLDYVRGVLNVPANLVGTEVEKRRGDVEAIVDDAIERALKRLSIPTRRDIEKMERRLDEIAHRLERRPATRRRRKAEA
jgi:hypothetical protein